MDRDLESRYGVVTFADEGGGRVVFSDSFPL